jgi:hypothetical protein
VLSFLLATCTNRLQASAKKKMINNNPTFIFQEVQKQYIQRAAKFKACQASQDRVPIIDNQQLVLVLPRQ